MADYKLEVIRPDSTRPYLTFTKGTCQHCPYVTQRSYAGYAEASLKEHLRDKHKIYTPVENWRKERR